MRCAPAAMARVAEARVSVKAVARHGATPPWDKGMIAINAEGCSHAIECGKQAAYEAWAAVRRKRQTPGISAPQDERRPRPDDAIT